MCPLVKPCPEIDKGEAFEEEEIGRDPHGENLKWSKSTSRDSSNERHQHETIGNQ